MKSNLVGCVKDAVELRRYIRSNLNEQLLPSCSIGQFNVREGVETLIAALSKNIAQAAHPETGLHAIAGE
jgi:hypothetical protein